MAVVDLRTGKIVGCKKNSLTWWHEKAHLVYNSSNRGIINNYRANISLMFTLGLLVANSITPSLIFKFGLAVSFFVFLIYQIYEETWCWMYAHRRKNEKKT